MDPIWIPEGHMRSIYGTHNLGESADLKEFPRPRCIFVWLWPPDVPMVGEGTHDYYTGKVLFYLAHGVIFIFSFSIFLTLSNLFLPLRFIYIFLWVGVNVCYY